MGSPADRRYAATHEWHKPEGGYVVIGLSQFAVDELTDVTFVDIRKSNGVIKAGEPFGEIESVKATSELYCGVDGTVAEVNAAVIENPGLVNLDPYARGWLLKVQPSDPSQLQNLLGAAEYDQQNPHK